MRSLAQARLKRVRAVELLADGVGYEEIAQTVGYTNRGSAHRAVTKALAEREIEAVDELRGLEMARLDALHAAYWDLALQGDIAAGRLILDISRQRRRLCGLDQFRTGNAGVSNQVILVQPWLESRPGSAVVLDQTGSSYDASDGIPTAWRPEGPWSQLRGGG